MAEGCRGCQSVEGAVRLLPRVLSPCHLHGIGGYILAADVVVLAHLGTAKAGKVTLGLVGAGAVIREGDGLVDAPSLEPGVQRIPRRRFVGIAGFLPYQRRSPEA